MYIGKIFDKDLNFPVENKLSIIIGAHGTGKTLTLKRLKEYFEQHDENVIYFPEPENRILTGDINEIKMILENNFSLELLDPNIENYFQMDTVNWILNRLELYINDYIDSGYVQLINFLYNILKVDKESIVIIDTPEAGLDIIVQRNLLQYLLNLCNTKKLIVCTHSPTIIDKYWDKVIDIGNCIQL